MIGRRIKARRSGPGDTRSSAVPTYMGTSITLHYRKSQRANTLHPAPVQGGAGYPIVIDRWFYQLLGQTGGQPGTEFMLLIQLCTADEHAASPAQHST